LKELYIHGKNGGVYTKVDDDIYNEFMNWGKHLSLCPKGYARFSVWDKETNKVKPVKLHRYITKAQKGEMVDHRNHDKLDNTRENLRVCTNKQNSWNQISKKKGTSKYKGVTFEAGKFRAVIMKDGKKYHLGMFESDIEAAEAYNRKAIELFGEYAALNEIKKL
jgi:hypothetical protein